MLELKIDKTASINLKQRNRQSRQREEVEASIVLQAERRLHAGEWQKMKRNMEKKKRDPRSWKSKDL